VSYEALSGRSPRSAWYQPCGTYKGGGGCVMLRIGPGNQRVLLHRARARVREALERYLDGSA
jgi:hypothetical protein